MDDEQCRTIMPLSTAEDTTDGPTDDSKDVTGRPTDHTRNEQDLLYAIDDDPPWYLSIILGFQHYLSMCSSAVTLPLIIAPALCLHHGVALAELVGTCLFVDGMVTILQVTLGSRLPIVQGGSSAYLAPLFAIMSLPQYRCPSADNNPREMTEVSDHNTTVPPLNNSGPVAADWTMRMNEVQGAIILASVTEVLIGMFGVVGLLLRYIGPLSVAPTITLIGLTLFAPAYRIASGNWWVAIMTMVLIITFSQYLKKLHIPCGRRSFPVFSLFPVILGVLVSWSLCYVLTVTDAIPDDGSHWAVAARTDKRTDVISQAKWFRLPYPGQWGAPTFSLAGMCAMLSAVCASVVESVGDYYACARLSGAPPPPVHAVNRGIFIEGVGSVMAGLWGMGTGSTSYSSNIGVIGISKVGNRQVVLWAGVVMIFTGLVNKLGAVFVAIPGPIIGGVLFISFGMIASVGVSNLQFVDLNSFRNLFVFGFSVFFGLAFSQWMVSNPGAINTGIMMFDQTVTVLLSTSMFVGGVLGFILDNTVPGTDDERGIKKWRDIMHTDSQQHEQSLRVYDLPFLGAILRRQRWTRAIPLCPGFSGFNIRCCPGRRKADPEKGGQESEKIKTGNDSADVHESDETLCKDDLECAESVFIDNKEDGPKQYEKLIETQGVPNNDKPFI